MGNISLLQPKVSISKRNEVFTAYVLFRPGVCAHETRHCSDGGLLVNVDVDRQNVPIGIEVVRYGSQTNEQAGAANVPLGQLFVMLFAASSHLAALLKSQHDKSLLEDGDGILREILESIKFLPDSSHESDSTLFAKCQ